MPVPLLKPRCALRVGIVGNRRFAGEHEDSPTPSADAMRTHAAAAAGVVWRALLNGIETVLNAHLPSVPGSAALTLRDLFDDARPRVAVISSLAAGSDQIGASAALEAAGGQKTVCVELEAVLPFSEEDYPGPIDAPRAEFRPQEARTLRELVAIACQVARLGGDYANADGRHKGYRQARDVLLQNSDLLIAIYDPSAERRIAGTAETVALALQTNTPVIAVLVEEQETRIALRTTAGDHGIPSAEWDAAVPLTDDSWRSRVVDCVRELLMLPEAAAPAADAEADRRDEGGDSLTHALQRLRLLSGSDRPMMLCRHRASAWLFRSAWRALGRVAAVAAPGSHGTRAQHLPASTNDAITLEPFAGFYGRASELSAIFMRTYRGAFVLSYLLASLAVAAAVALMAVALLTGGHVPLAAMAALCAVKLGILGLLLVLERAGRLGKFQEAAADFRYLAELLRPMQWLAPVGTCPPAVDLPIHSAAHDPRRSWMTWLARALARCSPCVAERAGSASDCVWQYPRQASITSAAAAAALDHARVEWLEGQMSYHRDNAHRMRTLNEGLERWAKWLLWTVLLAAVTACLLELLPHTPFEPWSGWAERAHTLGVTMGAAAAVLPAFIAALAGVAFQSEAKRLAARSAAMSQALRAQQRQLASAAASLRAGRPVGEATWRAAGILRGLSANTIEEAGDWKVLYEVHEIHAG